MPRRGICKCCHHKRRLTKHHKYDKRYIKDLGVISERFREYLRSIHFHICWECHEELNTKQSKCRIKRDDCYKCKFTVMCCHAVVKRGSP